MLIPNTITNLRDRINDTEIQEFENSTLINYINSAIDLVWCGLIQMNSGEVLKNLTISLASSTIPVDFQKFTCKHPLYIVGDQINFYGTLPTTLTYFRKPQHITEESVSMPFSNDSYNNIVLQLASMSLLNKNEFDIAQDKDLLDFAVTLLKGVI